MSAIYLVCKSLDTTLPCKSTVQKCIYPSVGEVHAGSFRVSIIHRTLTSTAGSLTCIYMCSLLCLRIHALYKLSLCYPHLPLSTYFNELRLSFSFCCCCFSVPFFPSRSPVFYYDFLWFILIRQNDCPSMRHEHGFPVDVWSPLQFDNHHHHQPHHHHHHHVRPTRISF